MSETTNDQIIEDLTIDLEAQCVAADNVVTSDNIPEHSVKNTDELQDNSVASAFNDDEDETATKSTVPDDFIDETELQNLESNLSPDELNARHQQSLDIKQRGNDEFHKELYIESISTYTEGLRLCPLQQKNDRAALYCNRAASKIKLKRTETAIDDCSKAIELKPDYIRAYLRRAHIYEEKEKLDEALEDFKKLLELDPQNKEALIATQRLPPIIQQRNEKLKEEMLGKLKDLGNMFLKPFGLSTDNFKLQQDPNSGGYNINFQQK